MESRFFSDCHSGQSPRFDDLSAVAVTIQRLFRGHLVRENLWLVSRIALEVEEIERCARDEQERLLGDTKERHRLGEMLRKLLFRLDSARGVRGYRKKVIRRVIALQEFVDSMAAQTQDLESPISTVLNAEIPLGPNPETHDPQVCGLMREENEFVDSGTHSEIRDSQPEMDTNSPAMKDAAQNPIFAAVNEQERGNLRHTSDEGFGALDCTGAPNEGELKPRDQYFVVSEKDRTEDEGFVVVSLDESLDDTLEQDGKELSAFPVLTSLVFPKAMAVPEIGQAASCTTDDLMKIITKPGQDSSEPYGMVGTSKKLLREIERLGGLVATLYKQSAEHDKQMARMEERIEHLEHVVQCVEK
ncbi:hypothetical protein Cni_G09299 [Canna indica]|uniref:BAG domain-containing protein n=1 Tax=Canna indica TaxID=4628 RepID=A0AAQ3Q8Q9_9LILI|nr:hypothetical protein Cni_G09299 [Canna indica]